MPGDVQTRAPRARHRRRWWILAAAILLIIILASLRTLATLYTDELWFNSVNLHSVWTRLLEVKVGLFASFGAIFFVLLWVNLVVTDRLSVASTSSDPEDELVRRYQRAVRPYAGWVYAILALVAALIAASGTIGEWQNWILFTHSVAFGVRDPQFHKDVGFFVFKLPFLSFVVDWALISLAVVTVLVAVFHYLNGGIRPQRAAPRVRPAVKAHLSVLLALIALTKAVGYILARYQLDVSTNGYVEGAGYTDVHARLPAFELLFWVSLAAAGVLLWNIRRQGWTLPVLAIGVWGFVALVVGVIYPAVLQAVKVNPAQATLEKPYIQRNIQATRAAYNVQANNVTVSSFNGTAPVTTGNLESNFATLRNIRLWDPELALPTVQKQQDIRTYYSIPGLNIDRYRINGHLTPAVVGVRQINSAGIQSEAKTWVNTHLVYTHGEGMVLAPANKVTSAGTPHYEIAGVPPHSSKGLPKVTEPGVYFGVSQSGWVVANTKQPEIDYQTNAGNNVNSHYKGPGGVQLSSFLRRAAFAVRLADFNVLISNQITSKSRIMFVRDIRAMAEKAAPFLTYDNNAYPVLVNGHIDWVLNAYTTTNQYPYSQNASTFQVPPNSGLSGNYNYVRNSVTVVVDAYTGKMTFYAMDPADPILKTYEAAFPSLFTPEASMPVTLLSHLHYPPDIFAIQSAVYGRYHISSPANFYGYSDAWKLSPTPGVGSPSQALQVVQERNSQGQLVSGPIERMQPLYQVQKLPGSSQQAFTITEAYVPTSNGDQIQTLSAFISASSQPDTYGQLHVFVTPSQNVPGPALVDSKIQADSTISRRISLLNQNGSTVLLGNVLMVPLDQSMLYVRPVYVTSNRNPFPTLQYVIAVLNGKISMEPTLDGALSAVFGTQINGAAGSGAAPPTTPSVPPGTSSAVSEQVKNLLKQADAFYTKAQQDLASKNLGAYEADINNMYQALKQAQGLLGVSSSSSGSSTSGSPSTTTTTKPPAVTPVPTNSSPSRSTTTHSTSPPSSSTTTKTNSHTARNLSTTTAPRSGQAVATPPGTA